MVSEATRKKMSESRKGVSPWNKGKKMDEAYRKRVSEASKGRKVSEATRSKISDTLKGRKCTIETRQKLSLSKLGSKNPMYGKKLSDTHKKKIIDKKLEVYGQPNPIRNTPHYGYLHRLVRKTYGPPIKCLFCCKLKSDGHMIYWANISQKYIDVNDFMQLCSSCHIKYDNKIKKEVIKCV